MVSATLVGIVAQFEGFRAKSYRCPAGVWTIGYGETKGIRPGDVISEPAARKRLAIRLEEFQTGVKAALGDAPATPNQLDAMTSLAYNIGLGAFQKSSVCKRHRAGDHAGAARAFALWNKAGGRVLPGLVSRRAAEIRLYQLP
jgi:lysozyme